jgi:hypothetical protein
MREAGLTTSEVLLDSKQQRFVARLANLLIDKVRDCSFRLHTLVFPVPYASWTLDLYLDTYRSIANTHGSPLHHRNRIHLRDQSSKSYIEPLSMTSTLQFQEPSRKSVNAVERLNV